jgi:hypothetical protein
MKTDSWLDKVCREFHALSRNVYETEKEWEVKEKYRFMICADDKFL